MFKNIKRYIISLPDVWWQNGLKDWFLFFFNFLALHLLNNQGDLTLTYVNAFWSAFSQNLVQWSVGFYQRRRSLKLTYVPAFLGAFVQNLLQYSVGFYQRWRRLNYTDWVYFEQSIVKSTQFRQNWVLFSQRWYTDGCVIGRKIGIEKVKFSKSSRQIHVRFWQKYPSKTLWITRFYNLTWALSIWSPLIENNYIFIIFIFITFSLMDIKGETTRQTAKNFVNSKFLLQSLDSANNVSGHSICYPYTPCRRFPFNLSQREC